MANQTNRPRHGKTTEGLINRANSLEPESVDFDAEQTPVEAFFACNTTDAPYIDRDSWRLTIDGDSASSAVEISISDLEALPQHRVDSWLECAGNGRQMFVLVDNRSQEAERWITHWMLGAIGMANWEGPRLADVLALAGLEAGAAWVGPSGTDVNNPEKEPVRMSLPLAKALHPDTIVALEMNGKPLIAAHGFPARLLVPGWVGAYSIKWLDRIEVTEEWVDSWRASTYYVLREPDGTIIGPATSHPVKSNLGLEWEASLAPGIAELVGCARSGEARIESVEWSLDGGPWKPASVVQPESRWAWVRFSFEVDLTPGSHQVRTRATDAAGNVQPDTQPFHPDGVLWSAVIPHPVTVTES